jgi:hypothetical protein
MAFKYRLELENGEPADPPTLASAVPNWKAGDIIHLGAPAACSASLMCGHNEIRSSATRSSSWSPCRSES